MRKLLLTSTFLLGFSATSLGADINRVWDLCAPRGTCETSTIMSAHAMAGLQPAVLYEGQVAQQRNPDPFHQFTPQPSAPTTVQSQPPSSGQNQPPQVLVQAPSNEPKRDLWDWIMVGLGGIATAFLGTNVLAGFRKPDFNNPNALRIMALQAAQAGIRSPVVDNLLNFPGEDMVERIADRLIDRRLAALGVQPGGTATEQRAAPGFTQVPTDKLSGLLDVVERLISRVDTLDPKNSLAQVQRQPVQGQDFPRT